MTYDVLEGVKVVALNLKIFCSMELTSSDLAFIKDKIRYPSDTRYLVENLINTKKEVEDARCLLKENCKR